MRRPLRATGVYVVVFHSVTGSAKVLTDHAITTSFALKFESPHLDVCFEVCGYNAETNPRRRIQFFNIVTPGENWFFHRWQLAWTLYLSKLLPGNMNHCPHADVEVITWSSPRLSGTLEMVRRTRMRWLALSSYNIVPIRSQSSVCHCLSWGSCERIFFLIDPKDMSKVQK